MRLKEILSHVCDSRIPESMKNPKLHYYEVRHNDMDWSEPETLETCVTVNFWGTVITTRPVNFNQDGYYQLSSYEKELLKSLQKH